LFAAVLSSAAGSSAPLYEPTWESLARHEMPAWFEDAKFGMFVDFGLYSVAGWAPIPDKGPTYPDWYLHHMYGEWRDYHVKTWGATFERDDFIPLFTAKAYDPEGLVRLARQAGMRYIVPFAKHHDGFCLWPSRTTGRDAGDLGPRRDLIGPLAQAARRHGLKLGFYTSLDEWEYPVKDAGGALKLRVWNSKRDATLVSYDAAAVKGKIGGKIPVADYARDYLVPQTLEFIDRYDPDILWFDGDWTTDAEAYRSLEMVAYFYNRAAGRKEVVVNDRLGKTRGRRGDFYTSEYGLVHKQAFDLSKGAAHKWEENRGISQSFGWNRQDTEASVISATAFVHMLANIVAHNGNLLLIVNLDGDGALPKLQAQRLLEIGRWLDVNGEAIYETRPWKQAAEGESVRLTRSKDGRHVYAISLGWPGRTFRLKSVTPAPRSKITMLGVPRPLAWRRERGELVIDIPPALDERRPGDHAYTFKIEAR
jgi:alpha-L-fucosidase